MLPVGAFPAAPEFFPPEFAQAEFLPELVKEPARSPLPGPFEHELREAYPDAVGCRGGNGPVRSE